MDKECQTNRNSAWITAVELGNSVPNILGELFSNPAIIVNGPIQWTAFCRPNHTRPGGRAAITILLQNDMDSTTHVSVSAVLHKHPNFLFERTDISTPGNISLPALDVVSVTLPLYIHQAAGVGTYVFKLDLQPITSTNSRRIRQAEVHDGQKTQWGKVLTQNAIGLGLAATLGVGFYSLPQKLTAVSLEVSQFAERDEEVPQSTKIETLWSAEKWGLEVLEKHRSKLDYNSFVTRMSFQCFQPALFSFIVTNQPTLNKGQCIALAWALGFLIDKMVQSSDSEADVFIRRLFEETLRRYHEVDGSSFEETFLLITFSRLLLLAGQHSRSMPQSTAPTLRDRIVNEAVLKLSQDILPANEFWRIWGLDGIVQCIARFPTFAAKNKSAILEAIDRDRNTLAPSLPSVVERLFQF